MSMGRERCDICGDEHGVCYDCRPEFERKKRLERERKIIEKTPISKKILKIVKDCGYFGLEDNLVIEAIAKELAGLN